MTGRQRRPFPKLKKEKLECMWIKIGKIEQLIQKKMVKNQKIKKTESSTQCKSNKTPMHITMKAKKLRIK